MLICNKEVLKKKNYCFYLEGARKLTSVKSRSNWDLACAASVEALLLFFEHGRLSILQNWLGISGLSVALPWVWLWRLMLTLQKTKPVQKSASALGSLSKSFPSLSAVFLAWCACTLFAYIQLGAGFGGQKLDKSSFSYK